MCWSGELSSIGCSTWLLSSGSFWSLWFWSLWLTLLCIECDVRDISLGRSSYSALRSVTFSMMNCSLHGSWLTKSIGLLTTPWSLPSCYSYQSSLFSMLTLISFFIGFRSMSTLSDCGVDALSWIYLLSTTDLAWGVCESSWAFSLASIDTASLSLVYSEETVFSFSLYSWLDISFEGRPNVWCEDCLSSWISSRSFSFLIRIGLVIFTVLGWMISSLTTWD